MAGIQRVE